jgi:hypothetical protein
MALDASGQGEPTCLCRSAARRQLDLRPAKVVLADLREVECLAARNRICLSICFGGALPFANHRSKHSQSLSKACVGGTASRAASRWSRPSSSRKTARIGALRGALIEGHTDVRSTGMPIVGKRDGRITTTATTRQGQSGAPFSRLRSRSVPASYGEARRSASRRRPV